MGYFGWTGSDRIEASTRRSVRLQCLILGKVDADRAFSPFYERYGYSCWRYAVTGIEGPYDQDRLRALRRVGLTDAAAELDAEIERQDAEWYTRLQEMVESVRRHNPATYAGWVKHLRSAKEGPESVLMAAIGGGVVQVIKLKYLDMSLGRRRIGLFDLEHHKRVRGDVIISC